MGDSDNSTLEYMPTPIARGSSYLFAALTLITCLWRIVTGKKKWRKHLGQIKKTHIFPTKFQTWAWTWNLLEPLPDSLYHAPGSHYHAPYHNCPLLMGCTHLEQRLRLSWIAVPQEIKGVAQHCMLNTYFWMNDFTNCSFHVCTVISF